MFNWKIIKIIFIDYWKLPLADSADVMGYYPGPGNSIIFFSEGLLVKVNDYFFKVSGG